jgi:miniconductance mechanosensitive channel
MDINMIRQWMETNIWQALVAAVAISIFSYVIARTVIARGLVYLAERTENTIDDMIVESLRPFRVAYLAPLFVLYSIAYLFPDIESLIESAVFFFSLWVLITILNSLLNALNSIYESRENFSGVAIQGYLDLVKMLFILVGVILTISIFTGQSPLILLSGLGALTAVLLIVFKDTLLSLVAAVRISTNDLVKQGDWIEVPSFQADGDVIDMSLHNITVQNWDKTISVVPTYRLLDTPFKNWRGMSESGGRRMKRALSIDMSSIKFLDAKDIKHLEKMPGLENLADEDGLTNVGAFRMYTEALMLASQDLHREGMTMIVRQLSPGSKGLPIELYAFTNTTDWAIYESIQAKIIEHLIAILPEFRLSIFQEASGSDFAKLA